MDPSRPSLLVFSIFFMVLITWIGASSDEGKAVGAAENPSPLGACDQLGRIDNVNQAGLDYYMNLIDELHANGIDPMVTMYHWDLPQTLQDTGGWLIPEIAQIFVDYVDLLFKTYGDKVKSWITINKPLSVVTGYSADTFAPALNMAGIGDYVSGHNLLRAHALLTGSTNRSTPTSKLNGSVDYVGLNYYGPLMAWSGPAGSIPSRDLTCCTNSTTARKCVHPIG